MSLKQCLCVLVFVGLWPLLAHSEIHTDSSLGSARALSGPDYQIPADLGQQQDGNLFHSFARFSLNAEESAQFYGADSIHNIITRVTGGELSNIDGRLVSHIDGANLYLFNPAGVLFGENAQVDISGSLYVASADYLRFSDDALFHADLDSVSNLSIAQPAAFGFLNNQASVTLAGSKLQLPARQTLSLTGSQVDIHSDAEIFIDSGTFALNGATTHSEVAFIPVETADKVGSVQITNALLASSGEGSGNVYVHAEQFIVRDSGVVQANSRGSGGGQGIRVRTNDLQLINGGQLVSSTFGTGAGGGIDIDVAGRAEFRGEDHEGAVSGLNSRSLSKADENGSPAGIHLKASELILRDGGAIEARVKARKLILKSMDYCISLVIVKQGKGVSLAPTPRILEMVV